MADIILDEVVDSVFEELEAALGKFPVGPHQNWSLNTSRFTDINRRNKFGPLKLKNYQYGTI